MANNHDFWSQSHDFWLKTLFFDPIWRILDQKTWFFDTNHDIKYKIMFFYQTQWFWFKTVFILNYKNLNKKHIFGQNATQLLDSLSEQGCRSALLILSVHVYLPIGSLACLANMWLGLMALPAWDLAWWTHCQHRAKI